MFSDFLKSKPFLASGFLALLFLTIFWGREMYRKYQINTEIRTLQSQIKELERSNQDTLSLISYFKTQQYKERQARSLLNLQKPGEFVVALPDRNEAGLSDQQSDIQTPEVNLRKWWNYFFGKN